MHVVLAVSDVERAGDGPADFADPDGNVFAVACRWE